MRKYLIIWGSFSIALSSTPFRTIFRELPDRLIVVERESVTEEDDVQSQVGASATTSDSTYGGTGVIDLSDSPYTSLAGFQNEQNVNAHVSSVQVSPSPIAFRPTRRIGRTKEVWNVYDLFNSAPVPPSP